MKGEFQIQYHSSCFFKDLFSSIICRETRKLIIPPHLAYGERGVEGAIPGKPISVTHCKLSLMAGYVGGATLIFSVELLELRKPSTVSVNRDTITILGVVVLVGLLIFEVVRRWKKEDEDIKQQKKTARKGSKKKR